ncbi:hypothetical protein SNE40_008439 [Patella caerulea]|uniref:Uncharacterized protein n=1 Tax=Patella caerulea TaxID=87958 RepID=A0AAN8K183_PATCE
MGYDIDRFLHVINEGLLCCICQDVLQDPVQAPCEHAFCRLCIQGWLRDEKSCPEDRRPLIVEELRPLFRYMKNDLDKLKIRCKNIRQGCQYTCNLEYIKAHERECMFETMSCPNMECSQTILKMDLSDHLRECAQNQKPKVCNKGCGLSLINGEDREHNCLTELRSTIQILRKEMTCQLDTQRKEMEARLDMQRGFMVQREAAMQTEIVNLRNEISRISQKVKLLLDLEERRKSDFDKMETERKELFELLRTLQKQLRASSSCPHCKPRNGGKVTTI